MFPKINPRFREGDHIGRRRGREKRIPLISCHNRELIELKIKTDSTQVKM